MFSANLSQGNKIFYARYFYSSHNHVNYPPQSSSAEKSTKQEAFSIPFKSTQSNRAESITMYLKRTKQSFCAIFGLCSLTITLYALVKFILFTSKPLQQHKQHLDGKSQELKVAIRHLMNNAIWLVVFILQHSFQKHENVKALWKKIGLQSIERSAYNLFSSFILLVSFLFMLALPGRFVIINQIKAECVNFILSNWYKVGRLSKSGRCGTFRFQCTRPLGGSLSSHTRSCG